MTAQIETFLWCSQNSYAEFEISGSSGKSYIVSYDMRDGWHCNCPAFKYSKSKTCKHIDEAKPQKCEHGWDAVVGSPAHDWTDDRKCPKCNSPVSPIKVAV